MNIPASTANKAMITLRPSKYTAGTSAATPETMSQMPSSNIPTFFEKFMEIFLSFYVDCECDGDI
jgi:hypothetical protein